MGEVNVATVATHVARRPIAVRQEATNAPGKVVRPRTDLGNGWRTRLPLIYDLDRGDTLVLASALNGHAHGYGASNQEALSSLLRNMVESLQSLLDAEDAELDNSAKALRDRLSQHLEHAS